MLAAVWALLAIGLSLFALVGAGSGPVLPFSSSFVGGGGAVILTASPQALEAGIEPGDRVRTIDGVPLIRMMEPSRRGLDLEHANEYEIEKRDGSLTTVALYPVSSERVHRPLDTLVHLALVMVSILYLGVGLAVWWNKPGTAAAWALLLFCSSMSMLIATALRAELIPWSTPRILANLPFLGATTFHLFTTYPIEPAWIVRHRRIRAIPYAIAFAIFCALILEQLIGRASEWLTAVAFFFGVTLALVSLGVLSSQRARARAAGIGDRTDLMLIAGVVSFLPALLVLIAEYFLQTPFPWYVAMLWVAIFPIAVGYGMLRKQLFDFRIVAKSSAAYGAATFTITGLFAFMITFADELIARYGVNVRSAQVAFLFLAILAFNPLRERLQGLVDRLFDRDRARYRQAVREISEAMVSMLSLNEIGDRILMAVTDTMGVGKAMVLLFDESDKLLRPAAWRGDWDDEDIHTEIPSDHPIWKHLWMRREELIRADFDDESDVEAREQCRDIYDTLEVELLVPILFGVDLLGVIAVGRKLSGERLAADDRQLLRTLANQSSIAIENAKAFDEIAKLNESLEARVEERTLELRETQTQLMQSEKMSSLGQLVAGVAHELNNPIGFVHANLQLLDEFIDKLSIAERRGADAEPVREAITKLLTRSREGTQRVKQIVQDLRTFSRMDQIELQTADLHEEVDRTLALMEPRLKNKIRVDKHYGDIPEVRCYPGQLNQVFLNLLMNACDVLERSGGTITIATEQSELGVRLEFRDDGPGIPPDVQSRIFDPFFTTKEVGKGTGLGLSLSHGIIERHGGRFLVYSEPGEGASFVIELPLDAAPPAQ
ncbi:MAG: GAF domain-containing sensor histidine kinase [Deltaproteobacteria bacterium]|nr:GAF domain-containing sensor histidine kinase [Deltaproteobacteria bacterium]